MIQFKITQSKFFIPTTLILFLVLTGFLVNFFTNKNQKNLLLSAVVAYAEGEVEYQQNNLGWKTIQSGQTLTQGTSVRVLSQGKAIINFDDGSSIRLNKNTTATLSDLSPSHMVITNSKGEVYSRVSKSDRTFTVNSGEVSYQAMGTAFSTINNQSEQGVQVYQSQVKVLGINSNNELLVNQGSQYYLVNTSDTNLENNITSIDINKINQNDFVVWNSQQDAKNTETKDDLGVLIALLETTPAVTATLTPSPEPTTKPTDNPTSTPKPETQTSGQIVLSAVKVDNGIKLEWTVTGTDSNLGFKVVRNESVNPVYPGNDFKYLSEPSVRSYTWELKDGKTYHFRVCKYLGGSCGIYSNDVTATAPSGGESSSNQSDSVTSISLSGSGSNISWTINGYSSKGFKVVWSKNSGATYPLRNDADKYHYYSEPDKRNDTLDAFSGSGTYYVRVCEYLGGKCGVYSNEIQVNL